MMRVFFLLVLVNCLTVILGFPEKNLTQNLSEFEENFDQIEYGEIPISLGRIGKIYRTIILVLATVWSVSFVIVPAIFYFTSGINRYEQFFL